MAEGVSGPQRGRGILRTASIAGALILSGCQSVVPRRSGPVAPPPPRAVQDQPQRVEPGIPTDTSRHRVALLVPLSGPAGGFGQSLANATQMALLDTKNEQVRITTYDTVGGAAAAAQKALADGNRLILGPLLAEDVRAVAPIARRAGVPVVSFSNDSTAAGNGAYTMGYIPGQSIERVVQYAKGQGISDFAGLVPNGTYGQRASTAFLRAVESAGGQVLTLQTYDRTPGSMTNAISRMARNSPYQAVLIADAGTTAAAAVPLIRKNGSAGVHVLGTELWTSEGSIAGKPALAGAWFAGVSDGLYRQYAAKYRARFGVGPYRMSSLGYDAVLLTVRIARDWPMNAPFPEERLRDRDGFAGIDGAFRFGRDDVAERALEVKELRSGTIIVVSPAPSGFGDR